MGISNVKRPFILLPYDKERHMGQMPYSRILGIAPTKTLSKLATEYAKKNDETGESSGWTGREYMDMGFMSQFECRNIWGIGRKISTKLDKSGIKTAADFIKKDEMWVKKTFGIMSLYTSWELKAIKRMLDTGGGRRVYNGLPFVRKSHNYIRRDAGSHFSVLRSQRRNSCE